MIAYDIMDMALYWQSDHHNILFIIIIIINTENIYNICNSLLQFTSLPVNSKKFTIIFHYDKSKPTRVPVI